MTDNETIAADKLDALKGRCIEHGEEMRRWQKARESADGSGLRWAKGLNSWFVIANLAAASIIGVVLVRRRLARTPDTK